MGQDYESYVKGVCALPDKYEAWPLYGVGLDNLGENQHPVTWDGNLGPARVRGG